MRLFLPTNVDSLSPRLCSKKHTLPTEDVHGWKTAAEGAFKCNFAYGVGLPIVGVIPGPRLGG